ncbi:heterogeneous nuclear ribonucleoprotein U-like protein 2 isoform X2 [Amphiprion ocellaris]|uniref:heterogeneous nuclear ribonucleoprotein U-like protein 2 isoform X2 n=1 Tax=Amphiprion ocellaris TaxID=80972 RepID=UPI0024113025|nr:heterogeneous nuclear ribonucleoprotein U-like protein 2 isoform X2 [Amphiprion ocellaris]XP_054872723.1 heterogeneous nuclear ribonucleoprotein U-like protein 2 isoform X2 [Amphiprion ocellaris]XP_054872724.1 heterogeneous nuclear ribonucleoprotein U-like protein 2 isoform X2 [Amphiprion ocellaris]XP_054872725.1 heterogeneous nuclear ribonucleoprotein U-like protein 2 isoform X2 [Amphiprion ocellaris]XP_054872726.1 heterogeneous nuclear ribonucleoprotein U-like protein 2 isoform X2 [Amphipr
MKLTDIKKLKVAELRSRLKELGLDSRGLKAELVDRLWSATEAGPGGTDDGEQVRPQPSSSPTQQVHTPSSSPPTEAGVPAACEADPGRELTDTGTQTEAEPGPPVVHPGSECASGGVTVCQAEAGESGHAEGSGEDRGALSVEDLDRGRAFYEFKEEIRYKRAKSPQPLLEREEAEEQDEDKIRLDPYGCHLHFEVGPDGSCGQPRFWSRFPLLWSGCRLTHGVQRGRVGFEVRLERRLLNTQPEDQDIREPYGLRVGWSVADSSLLLGEDELSFSYDGRGKKVSCGKEQEFGEPFSEGDIIGCYASFSSDGAVELSFHKNGRFMGVAFTLDASVLLGCALFPHVLCKSCSVRLLLDPTTPPWYPEPPGFTPLAVLRADQRVRSTSAPSCRAQCEVVLMVGLPGSGKTLWARTHMKQHPEKQYKLLGTEELLACMISGGQNDSRLRQASQCLTDLIKMAAETPANYILDQCNILFSARRHKLQLFAGFRRRVVVVFPSADEWKRRLSQHQMSDGEHIPATALLKLQVSCSLPEQPADLLEELQYVDLPQQQAHIVLLQYKDEARRLLPPVHRQDKKKPRLYKKRPHPHGPPAPRRTQWTGFNGRNDTRINMQPWSQQPRYWNVPHQEQSFYYNRGVGYSGYEGYW